MADISKINPNGTEYNLKDATARSAIENTNRNIQSSITVPKASVVTVTDAYPMNAEDITVDITSKQDLHGYDHPWFGGAGKNIYVGSPSFDGYNDIQNWVKQTETYNGHDIYKRSDLWGGAYQTIFLPVGVYTFSCSVKTNDASNVVIYTKVNNVTTASVTPNGAYIATTTNWSRVSLTFEVTVAGTVGLRIERYTQGDIYISEYQIEKGSQATSYEDYENICPIEGWTSETVDRYKVYQLVEANNFSNSTENGITLSYQGGGTFKVKGSLATAEGALLTSPIIPFTIYDGTDSYIRLNNTYANSVITLEFYNSGGFVDNWMMTPAYRETLFAGMRGRRTDQINIRIPSSEYGTYFDFTFKVEIYSSSADNHKEYTVNFGQTVYGGKWHSKGGTDKTHASVILNGSEENWHYSSSYGGYAYNTSTAIIMPDFKASTTVISDKLEAGTVSELVDVSKTNIVCLTSVICIKLDSSYDTVDKYIAWLANNPLQVCYELATPTTINTNAVDIPMLQGINTISASTGDVSLKYQPDNVVGELKGEIQVANSFVAKMALRKGSGAKDFSYGGWSFRLYIYRSMGQIAMSVEDISATSVTEQAVVKVFNGESDYRAPEYLRPIFNLIQAATYTTPSGWAIQVYLKDDGYIMFTGIAPEIGASAPTRTNWNLVEPWLTHQQAKDLFD